MSVFMHVISKRPFSEAAKRYPNQRDALEALYKILCRYTFKSPQDMKKILASLDNFKYKDKYWIIDIGGNNLRLIGYIQFQLNRFYVKHIVTHAEYDKLCRRYARGEIK